MNHTICKRCSATLTSADDEAGMCTQCDAKLPALRQLFIKIAGAYSDDAGTSDLSDSQPVYDPKLNLGDVRAARSLLQ